MIGFKQEPPTIDEFVESDYYIGNYFKFVYPFWREKLREIYPDNVTTTATNIVFTGAIGGGKTTASQIIMAYDVCRLCCVEDVGAFYMLNAQQGYHIKMFNIYKHKAQDFVDVMNEIFFSGKIPFFEREMAKGNPFLTNLHIAACSREKDIISNDVILFHLSELNFVPKIAKGIISSAASRLSARFSRGKKLFNHIIIDSSATSEDSPVDQYINEDPDASNSYLLRLNVWDPQRGLGKYFNYGKFRVYAGDSQRNPFILRDGDSTDHLDQDRIIEVPNELRVEFERDIVLALQEKAGLSTSTSSKFFTNLELLKRAYKLPKDYDDVVVVDFYDRTDTLYSKLYKDVLKLPTDRKLYARIDCGVANDVFGLCIGYADGVRTIEYDGAKTERLLIKIPIAVGISRYEGQETPINKIEDFLLRINQDYDLALVLTDQYQSTELRQIMLQNGIEAKLESVDRTDDAYLALKSYIYQGLVEIADNNLCYNEMSRLVRVGPKKVDHPATSSKDISDTVAGLVKKLIELGPEEVLEPPIEEIQESLYQVYDNMNNYRNMRSMVSSIGDYL